MNSWMNEKVTFFDACESYHVLIVQSKVIYTWGAHEFDPEPYSYPLRHVERNTYFQENFPDGDITHLCCLHGTAFVAVQEKGKTRIFGWGSNTHALLGMEDLDDFTYEMIEIEGIHPDIKAFVGSWYQPVILQQDGSLLGWGTESKPLDFTLKGCVSLSGGQRHFLAVMEDGALFAWGSNADQECLSHVSNRDYIERPERVWCVDGPVDMATAGNRFSVAALRSGYLVLWGCLFDGHIYVSHRIKLTSPRLKFLKAGHRSIVWVTENDKIFEMRSSRTHRWEGPRQTNPIPISVTETSPITFCVVEHMTMHVLREDNVIHSWGQHHRNQFCFGTFEKEWVPQPITFRPDHLAKDLHFNQEWYGPNGWFHNNYKAEWIDVFQNRTHYENVLSYALQFLHYYGFAPGIRYLCEGGWLFDDDQHSADFKLDDGMKSLYLRFMFGVVNYSNHFAWLQFWRAARRIF